MERWLSFAYVAVVLGLGVVSLWPRLTTQFASARVVQQTTAPNEISPLTPGPAGQAQITQKVNLNTASQAELESLPGVGPALAQRIVEGRPYARAEDLDKVRGVGPRVLERLRPLVTP